MALSMDAELGESMNQPKSSLFSPQEEALFLELLDIEDPTERDGYLDRVSGDNVQLRNAIQSMLDDYSKATFYFNRTSQSLEFPGGITENDELEPDRLLGSYRIVRMICEGGSSKVYEAEQLHPVKRKVAIKILKLGMDTNAVIRRFESERQTLAMLEHPLISQVYDAGATSTGRPYFVMELVSGVKITDYCRTKSLDIDDRIRLLRDVCSALQHAHNKGIIHRDIKPSNILVTEIDGIPIPKLIDFGIAKVTDNPVNDGRTILGLPMGTPAYMSPEQFNGPSDLDTRTDIYSLGVVFYEILAGHTPFKNDELIAVGFEKMRRRVQLETPKAPLPFRSGRNSSNQELNWIALKAIEKDREDRFSTVHAFAADLERYLRDEPIQAHPPSRLYRFQKLVARNRLATASICVAIFALSTGFVISTLLYFRAREAEQVQTVLRKAAEERAYISEAAILIMKGKTEEADSKIRQIDGVLNHPSLEATSVFQTLAMWSAQQGDWESAADRWLAMTRVNHFDDTDMSDKVSEYLLPIAPTLLMTGDFKRYAEFQEFLLRRLQSTTHPFAAEHLLKLCLIIPASDHLLHRLQNAAMVAEQSLDGDATTIPSDRMEAWCCFAIALWYYRSGDPANAILWSDRSLLRRDWEESRIMMSFLLRSMCFNQMGNTERAIVDLNMAKASIEVHLEDSVALMKDGHFHDWMIAGILLQEATALIQRDSQPTPRPHPAPNPV
jgi:eukaryotic-like serine/threonine-protein kinase